MHMYIRMHVDPHAYAYIYMQACTHMFHQASEKTIRLNKLLKWRRRPGRARRRWYLHESVKPRNTTCCFSLELGIPEVEMRNSRASGFPASPSHGVGIARAQAKQAEPRFAC